MFPRTVTILRGKVDMKTFRTMAVAVALLSLAAGTAMAQLSDAYSKWDETAVQLLLTSEEKAAWKKIKTDADAETFVALFWARRDPTPGTARNEWKEMFEKRASIADERFSQGKLKGSLTDRGKVFILLGAPTRISGSDAGTNITRIEDMGGAGETPAIVWKYEAPVVDETKLAECKQSWKEDVCRLFMVMSGAPSFAPVKEFEVNFIDQNQKNNWKLTQGRRSDTAALLKKAQEFYVFQPALTEVPAAEAIAEVQVPATPAKPATSFSSKELEAAYREFRALEKSPYSNVYVSYGEYITADGDYFVPVQLYIPKNDAIIPNQQMSFFGVIENASGEVVSVFDEPITVAASKTDVYVDKSLTLTPGEYRGTFGLAVDNKPVTIASTKLALSGIDASKPSISPLLISNNIFPLSAPQLPTDPFAFGGIKVVPKGDRTFVTTDELWYFFELRSPGLDPTTSQPKIQVGVEVAGKTADGKTKKMRNPLMEVPAQELKGVPGHYAVGSAIPLESFPAGDYTIELKVLDTVTKQTFTLKEPFKVVK
ncbi:MAG TPA: GWxTD domain-containing protein [Thermoanaerobaculia bacterium]|nr:GWxTD domain-containing protein [Thermoanaerobaculia bacterium]